MDDPPRYVSAYGDPDDLADEIDRAYGADVARRFRAHIASRDVVDALSGADVAAAVMASRDELAAIADRLRADPALRDAMLCRGGARHRRAGRPRRRRASTPRAGLVERVGPAG